MLKRIICIAVLFLLQNQCLFGYQKLCFRQWGYEGAVAKNPFTQQQDYFLSFSKDGRVCHVNLNNRDRKKVWKTLASYESDAVVDDAMINDLLNRKEKITGSVLQDYLHYSAGVTVGGVLQQLCEE